MPDFTQTMAQNQDLPEKKQKQAGQAIAGDMEAEHTEFVKLIARMITEKEIDVQEPETFLKRENYDQLTEDNRGQVNLAMLNIADLLRKIAEFYMSKETPDSSPQLANMIEQLWQMKMRVEEQYGDVFKF